MHRRRVCFHVAAGKGTFTAAVEVQEQQRLVVSFLHHQPVQRLSHNPLERQDVVGVTNYLDVGLQARQLVAVYGGLVLHHDMQNNHTNASSCLMLGSVTEQSKSEPSQSQAEETHHQTELLQAWHGLFECIAEHLIKQH